MYSTQICSKKYSRKCSKKYSSHICSKKYSKKCSKKYSIKIYSKKSFFEYFFEQKSTQNSTQIKFAQKKYFWVLFWVNFWGSNAYETFMHFPFQTPPSEKSLQGNNFWGGGEEEGRSCDFLWNRVEKSRYLSCLVSFVGSCHLKVNFSNDAKMPIVYFGVTLNLKKN